MSEKKRLEDELDGLDWDAELANWEERTFPVDASPTHTSPPAALAAPAGLEPIEPEEAPPTVAQPPPATTVAESLAAEKPTTPPAAGSEAPAADFTQDHGAPLSGAPLWGEGDVLDLSAIDAFFEQTVSGVTALAEAAVAEADASAVARGITDRANNEESARPPPFRAPMLTPLEEAPDHELELTPHDPRVDFGRTSGDPHRTVVPASLRGADADGGDSDEETAVFRGLRTGIRAGDALPRRTPLARFPDEPVTGQRFPDEEETTVFASSTRRPQVAASAPGDDSVESSAHTARAGTAPPAPTARPVVVPQVTGAARADLLERALWLESEARAQRDRVQRARSLLVVSELLALSGEVDQAAALAREASLLSPQVAMATRQARALALGAEPSRVPGGPDPGLELFDLEARHAPTPAAKLHVTLLAADRQRLAGNDIEAAARWEQASRMSTTDVRAPLARAARALARGEAPRISEGPEQEPLAQAVKAALRLRGGSARGGEHGGGLKAGAALEPGDALARARDAIARRDFEGAAHAVAALRKVPGLAAGASWLAAAFGAQRPATRAAAIGWLEEAPVAERPAAFRAASALATELGDIETLARLLGGAREAFAPSDRLALAALLQAPSLAGEGDEAQMRADPSMRVVSSALSGARGPRGGGSRGVGSKRASRALSLGRLLAAGAPAAEVDEVLFAMAGDHDAETRAVALEMAVRGGQVDEVSDALGSFRDPGGAEPAPSDRQLAAGFVAERVGDRGRAVAAYQAALELDPASEVALRARMATEGELDATRCFEVLAASTDDHVLSSFALLEAVAREPYLDEQHREAMLEASHRATPELTIAPFLAEEHAVRTGQREAALGWVRARRSSSEDPVERAFFELREAHLLRDSDAPLAMRRLEAALAARPDDLGLADALGRLPGGTGGALSTPAAHEERANRRTGKGRAADFLIAAYGYEREGDFEAARRAALAAREALGTGGSESGVDAKLVAIALERIEVASGTAEALADSLLDQARSTDDPAERRGSYERLADLDAQRGDNASALLWHRSILETTPDHLPSLRHVEHALLGEGRGEELEPIALGIARALGEAGAGETSAHAAIAVRLRMRGATGEWEPTRAPTELAAFLPDPPLWALRGANAHARVHADDEWLARTSLGLAERTQRPLEVAALVLRAAEAATRRGALEAARALLERASHEDQGDVVAWAELAFVCRRLGDPRAAAEAWESVARTSMVEIHQASAWYQAGCLWLDEVRDVERGTSALEQVAAVDIGYGDVVQRLGMLYGQRGSRGELASLLERRLSVATTDVERLSLEIERGRALLAMGDPGAAREAFDAALSLTADQPEALAGLADAAAAEEDWAGAEQALVRLARVAVEPNEHQRVYRRLSALYTGPLVNLPRAERALREVLRRVPGDPEALSSLVDVYLRMREPVQAAEIQRELVQRSTGAADKRARRIKLAALYEDELHEPRKAEQALEEAREEAPKDPELLRLLVGLYRRHQQTPAAAMAIDRALASARKALEDDEAEVTSPLRLLELALELGGREVPAAAVRAALRSIAVDGDDEHDDHDAAPAPRPWSAGTLKPVLDERLAPEGLSAPIRDLLARRGDLLDAAAPLDQAALSLSPLEAGPLLSSLVALGATLRVDGVRVLATNELATACLPVGSRPPTVAIGRTLADDGADPALRTFLVARALKLVQARASVFLRLPAGDLTLLVAAWVRSHDPSFAPEEIPLGRLAEAQARIEATAPRALEPELRPLAREAAQAIASQLEALPLRVRCWANRTALLIGGDLGAALRAIALDAAHRGPESAPRDTEVDAPNAPSHAWLEGPEARDLLRFVASEAYLTLESEGAARG